MEHVKTYNVLVHGEDNTIFFYSGWYCQKGGTIVNHTMEDIEKYLPSLKGMKNDNCIFLNLPITTAREFASLFNISK